MRIKNNDRVQIRPIDLRHICTLLIIQNNGDNTHKRVGIAQLHLIRNDSVPYIIGGTRMDRNAYTRQTAVHIPYNVGPLQGGQKHLCISAKGGENTRYY